MKKKQILALSVCLLLLLCLMRKAPEAAAEAPIATFTCAHKEGEHRTEPPTCTESGVEYTYCAVCGEVLAIEYTPPLGHEWGEDGKCIRCGETNPDPTPAPAPPTQSPVVMPDGPAAASRRELVITGPIGAVSVTDGTGAVLFARDEYGSVLTSGAFHDYRMEEKNGGAVSLFLALPDMGGDYCVTVTVRGSENGREQPMGVSLYTLGENDAILELCALYEPLLVLPGERVYVDVMSRSGLFVSKDEDATECMAMIVLTGENDTQTHRIEFQLQLDGDQTGTQQYDICYCRYGEVTCGIAPDPKDMRFDGWYLGNALLTRDRELYFFASEDTTLVARYTSSAAAPEEDETPAPGAPSSGGSGLVIGLIALGTVLLAGILAAVLIAARRGRENSAAPSSARSERKREASIPGPVPVREPLPNDWQANPNLRPPMGGQGTGRITGYPPTGQGTGDPSAYPPEPPTRIEVWDPKGF